MGRALIPDNNVLVDYERGALNFADLGRPDDYLLVPAVVLAEYQTGVEMADTPERARRRQDVLDTFLEGVEDVLEFTEATARHYGVLAAHTIRTGTQRGKIDLMIAAHAVQSGGLVVSSDFRARFDDLPGVRSAG